MTNSWMAYDERVQDFIRQYESVRFEDVHKAIIDYIPGKPALILDIGSGSGRDTAWLAKNGHDVVAVEPSKGLRKYAEVNHSSSNIQWINDSLPSLKVTHQLGLTFDFILLSAVWMHVPESSRERAFRKLVTLLKPGGYMAISLRLGAVDPTRDMFPVSIEELDALGRRFGVATVKVVHNPDLLRRKEVSWATIIFKLPDDGTGALVLLRHIILTDTKSSTYKLALLRVLSRIADSSPGIAVQREDETVSIPAGLVGVYWIRMFKPLLESDFPQTPKNRQDRGLGFVRAAFRKLDNEIYFNLRIGAVLSERHGRTITQAIKDAVESISSMPATHITFPGSDKPIFVPVLPNERSRVHGRLIDASYLWSFGELRVPVHIWSSFRRFAAWIEPAIVAEWIRLSQQYADGQGRTLSIDQITKKLAWQDPERDTARVREIFCHLINKGVKLECVWSGKLLSPDNVQIDHCFPYSVWPCNDLWNLVPAHPMVNLRKKDKLISASILEIAHSRIDGWWEKAYNMTDMLKNQFYEEARAALTLIGDTPDRESVFSGVHIRRATLKSDLGLREWSG